MNELEAVRIFARMGGRSKSAKKAAAARENGKRGGWHAQKRNVKPKPDA
jgi:hypothetical protein